MTISIQAPNPSSSGHDGGISPSSGDQPLGLSRRGASVFPLAWDDVMQDKDLGGDLDGRRGSSKPELNFQEPPIFPDALTKPVDGACCQREN